MTENIKVYLPGIPTNKKTEDYLTENDFELRFSLFNKLYYRVVRPLLPGYLKHWLQNQYTKNIHCNSNFIFADLVEELKSNPVVWSPFIKNLYPEAKKSAIVLTHDVETQAGFDYIPKVIDLEKKYGFRGSWNIVPAKYRLHNDILKYITETGNEIGIHGYHHDGRLYYSPAVFSHRAKLINLEIKKFGAKGFRSPLVHRNLKWLQQLDIEYDASCFDYDPYQPFPGGSGSIWPFIAGKFVELPYTVPQDHVLFYTLKKKNIDIWIEKTKWLTDNNGMILTLTHPDYLKEKNHLDLYETYLNYLSGFQDTWHGLPAELARWVKNKAQFEA